MKRYILFVFLITAFLSFACNLAADLVEQIAPDVPEATAVAQPDDAAQPDDPTQLTDPLTGSSALSSDYAGLTSYRSRTVVTDLDTRVRQESTAEAVIEPFAMRMSMEMGEMILTEAGVWMEMPGLGWYQLGLTAAELTMSREQLMALEWGGDMDDLPDIPPWPSQILFMPDQASLSLVEGGLTPAGRDSLNGIPCQQYNIVTDYSEVDETMLAGWTNHEDWSNLS